MPSKECKIHNRELTVMWDNSLPQCSECVRGVGPSERATISVRPTRWANAQTMLSQWENMVIGEVIESFDNRPTLPIFNNAVSTLDNSIPQDGESVIQLIMDEQEESEPF